MKESEEEREEITGAMYFLRFMTQYHSPQENGIFDTIGTAWK
jgi:hypothetical protein